MRIANLISGLFCLMVALYDVRKGYGKLAILNAVLASVNLTIWAMR